MISLNFNYFLIVKVFIILFLLKVGSSGRQHLGLLDLWQCSLIFMFDEIIFVRRLLIGGSGRQHLLFE